ncbi:retron St85 family RNA-directed DNA polymerase [Klebsiella quasivariicola]|uniref:retron St85 family RNA-directed DNA polymerase n=1 Tax=Klebsiella quasivariicola TaxID=2026240 RepID=UPI001CCC9D76|nr:retron St85 family RNA-directed DNA polymerase [Klebsiella quasivariicola]MBZ9578934.1 retron St85 family RNA-directed DNA polymerase [Klebsiella quasivariicola]
MKIEIPYQDIGISRIKLAASARRSPLKYKVYKIPKRHSGVRVIAQPTPEVKDLQRRLVGFLRTQLTAHPCATAYEPGKGIRENAQQHVNNRYLLKMDFSNFFNSIKPEMFKNALLHDSVEIDDSTLMLLINIFFWCPGKKLSGKLVLSVGAPSSPFISNYVMKKFDQLLSEICAKAGITYTRYADDMTFSTQRENVLFMLKEQIATLLAQSGYENITINESKTVFSSKAHNRHVTGVTLTNDNQLSVGRKNKRYASSLIFRFKLGELSTDETLTLKGLLAHYFHIEPAFKLSMKKKYGIAIINDIVNYQE